MKWHSAWCAVGLVLGLCLLGLPGARAELPDYNDVLSITNRHIEAEDSHNITRILDTLVEDCVFKFEFMPLKTWHGHKGATDFYNFLFGLIPDFHVSLEEFVLGEQGAAVLTKFTGWDIKTHAVLKGKFATVQLFDRGSKLSAGEKFYLFWKNAQKEANNTDPHRTGVSKLEQLRLRRTSTVTAHKDRVNHAWNLPAETAVCGTAQLSVVSGVDSVWRAEGVQSAAEMFAAMKVRGGSVRVGFEMVGTEGVWVSGAFSAAGKEAVEFVSVFSFDPAKGCFDAVRVHVHSEASHNFTTLGF